MAQPERLRQGKVFQKIVQNDFSKNTKDGAVHTEAQIRVDRLKNKILKSGRADILITELGDFVTILEIKATDWDRIIPRNIKKNLWRHQRQLLNYVSKFLEVDKLDVCLGIIYPKPPKQKELRQIIESYLEDYGIPSFWYNEIRSNNKANK